MASPNLFLSFKALLLFQYNGGFKKVIIIRNTPIAIKNIPVIT